METANNIFHSLYEKFKESPLVFTAFLILSLGTYIIYTQVDNLKQYFPTAAHESAQFDASLIRDQQINDALEDSREFYQAKGIVIGQFHNGQYDLTRLPFTKVSVTYYSGDLTVEEGRTLYDERPLSTMNRIMLDMWADKNSPKCIAKETQELRDVGYRQRMENLGIKFVTLCPITNIRNYPIGYLSVGYDMEDIPREEVEILLDYQRTLSARIAGYLQEGAVDARN